MSAKALKLVESSAVPAPKPPAKAKDPKPKPKKTAKPAPQAAKKRAATPLQGKRDVLAMDLMTSPAVSCSVHATLNEAARLMWEENLGAIVVVDDDGFPVSMLTDRDVSMAAYTQGVPLHQAGVASAMSRTMVTAKVTTTAHELRELMAEAGVRRVPIVDETNRLRGVVGLADVVAEALAVPPKNGKRGTSAAMLARLMGAMTSPAQSA